MVFQHVYTRVEQWTGVCVCARAHACARERERERDSGTVKVTTYITEGC